METSSSQQTGRDDTDLRVRAVAEELIRHPTTIPQSAFAPPVHPYVAGTWVRPRMELPEPYRDLYRFWQASWAGGALPTIETIEPERFARHLAYIILLEAIDGGLDARYRVYGSGIAGAAGRDWTGFTISEMTAITGSGESVFYRSGYLAVALRREPLMVIHHSHLPMAHREWRRLILPFADEGGAVARFLVLNKPYQRHYQTQEEVTELRRIVGKGQA